MNSILCTYIPELFIELKTAERITRIIGLTYERNVILVQMFFIYLLSFSHIVDINKSPGAKEYFKSEVFCLC